MDSVHQWKPPADYRSRPVAILGGGTLGKRIAACWVSGGYDVIVQDPSDERAAACMKYVHQQAPLFPAAKISAQELGNISTTRELSAAVKDAFIVIECVPENLELKLDIFAKLESIAPADTIFATNSSSYKSSEMIERVDGLTKQRIMNTHYLMPPDIMFVELMTDGYTDPAVIKFVSDRQRDVGARPYVARKESTGLIMNRLWAAIKRETLSILAEGVSEPREIDELFDLAVIKGRMLPCKTMDDVGLDTVAFIESHYIAERGLSGSQTVDFLEAEYLSKSKLGTHSAKGGLYPRVPQLFALDVGVAADEPSSVSGAILSLPGDGKGGVKTLVDLQSLPDGIDIDPHEGRFFWTSMGFPGREDGELHSAKLDGSSILTIVPKGTINTPKQLAVEPISKKLYFCDREGLSVYRTNYDGTEMELLVKNGDWRSDGFSDETRWCVGVAVSPSTGKFYWTQKGKSKGGQGQILCANISAPEGVTASDRTDKTLLWDHLPEPVDLEIDEANSMLYWADRGEQPFGNSINRVKLNPTTGLPEGKYEVIVRHLHEAIGLKIDPEAGRLYFTDLGGSIYQSNLDGSEKQVVFSSDIKAFTGITLL